MLRSDCCGCSYSGHGSQTRDYSGDERDSMNETLCPTDFDTAGMIVDDELNQLLINPLPQGVRMASTWRWFTACL